MKSPTATRAASCTPVQRRPLLGQPANPDSARVREASRPRDRSHLPSQLVEVQHWADRCAAGTDGGVESRVEYHVLAREQREVDVHVEKAANLLRLLGRYEEAEALLKEVVVRYLAFCPRTPVDDVLTGIWSAPEILDIKMRASQEPFGSMPSNDFELEERAFQRMLGAVKSLVLLRHCQGLGGQLPPFFQHSDFFRLHRMGESDRYCARDLWMEHSVVTGNEEVRPARMGAARSASVNLKSYASMEEQRKKLAEAAGPGMAKPELPARDVRNMAKTGMFAAGLEWNEAAMFHALLGSPAGTLSRLHEHFQRKTLALDDVQRLLELARAPAVARFLDPDQPEYNQELARFFKSHKLGLDDLSAIGFDSRQFIELFHGKLRQYVDEQRGWSCVVS